MSPASTSSPSPPLDYDIAIVGYGPVGQTAAILMGRLGYRVGVFERWPSLYPRPRAVHYDDEVGRIFQHLGIAGQLEPITEPATTYEWQNADGRTLLALDRSRPGPSGWPSATMFSQPQLEELLDRTAKEIAAVEVHQGWEVSDLLDTGSHVRLRVRRGEGEGRGWRASGEERDVTAAYVIGCDGANSLVRERMGTPLEDLGFAFDWLIADTIPRDPALLAGVNLQQCNPERPTTLVSGGPGRRRWEWMLLPGESAAEIEQPEAVWKLLARSGIGRDDVALERHTVYTFRARWAQRWREGRMLLAGDAAHQMPPFAGQGLCSGIRDVFTLSWQLDLVLKGRADESTLDAYTSERCGHLQHAIAMSVELGKVICISDQNEAAARDELLLGVAADPSTPPVEPPVPNLGPGIHEGADGAGGQEAAGSLFPQGRSPGGQLLEDTLPPGFVLYALDAEPGELLDDHTLAQLGELRCALVALDGNQEGQRIYRDWFSAHDCTIALVRPDFYVFGTATTAAETHTLVHRLRAALIEPDHREERLAS